MFLLVKWGWDPPPGAFYKPFMRLFCLIGVVSAYLPNIFEISLQIFTIKSWSFFGVFLKEL
jgi:hypothetical protein